MKIALIVEGQTEKVFLPFLGDFLQSRLPAMPKIDPVPYNGRIKKGDELRRDVTRLLAGPKAADHVVALTDVYTGTQPPDFKDAADAKAKLRQWVRDEPRFHAHAAQYDFEAWLLPYWSTIQKLAKHNKARPGANPESVNHNKPPSYRIKEIFETGKVRSYVKVRDAQVILKKNGIQPAVAQCPELKALVNTILQISGGEIIP